MQLHEIQHQKKRRKRVGRGGNRGTTSCRGTKGQKARSGGNIRPGFEGGRTPISKMTPKLRGMNSKMGSVVKHKKRILRMDRILVKYKDGETISPDTLIQKGLLDKEKSRYGLFVKLVGGGPDYKVDKKVNIENCDVSKKLQKQLEKVGGKVEQE